MTTANLVFDSAPLPTRLRSLRVETDNPLQIRRTVQLAAAKIEDLEQQVAQLAARLQQASGSPHAPGQDHRAG